MRRYLYLLLMTAFAFTSCKQETTEPSQRPTTVKKLGTVGLEYKNDRLVKIGREELFYDANGRLIRSRIITPPYHAYSYRTGNVINGEQVDVYHNAKYVYAYHWQGDQVTEIRLDTLLKESEANGEKKVIKKLIDQPFCNITYQDGKIQTVTHLDYNGDTPLTNTSTYIYDNDHNIRQANHHYFERGRWVLNGGEHQIEIVHNSYDESSNPYYMLYEALGTITPSMFASISRASVSYWNISANNPIQDVIKNESAWQGNEETIDYTYQYNKWGLPIRIEKRTNGMRFPKETTINVDYDFTW